MRKIIVITLFAVMLLAACDPVSVPDVSDVIPDIVNQEPKPDEKPEDKPPAEVPPAENVKEDAPSAEEHKEVVDILKPIVGKAYVYISGNGPCVIGDGAGFFEMQILKTATGYSLVTEVGTFNIIRTETGKYMVEDYVISVSEDGKKITIGESVYE